MNILRALILAIEPAPVKGPLLEQMKMSDIITCSSKELCLLEQVMMLDIFTSNFTGGLVAASNEIIQSIYLLLACQKGRSS